MKICSNCKIIKDENEFYSNKKLNSGFKSNCKYCISLYQKNYYIIKKEEKKNFCQCGCGEKCYNNFVLGHHNKVREIKEYIYKNIRVCPKCKIAKNLDSFTKNRSSKSGVGIYCLSCSKAKYYERKYTSNKYKLCLCGCNNFTIAKNSYCLGHLPKKALNNCACGCGGYCKKRYIKGHSNLDKTVIEKISKSNKEYYKRGGESHRVTLYKGYFSEALCHYVRSLWEENICKIIKHIGFTYEYEPKRFNLSDGTTYLPDLYIKDLDLYVEIKGLVQGRKSKNEYKSHLFVSDKLGNMWLIDKDTYKSFLDTFGNILGLQKRRDRKAKLSLGCPFDDDF